MIRLVPRGEAGPLAEGAVLLGAVVLAASAGALLFALAGAPPLAALLALVSEPFGSAYGWSETLLATVPLAFCAVAVVLAREVGLWNIGAEGQLLMGAFAATAVGLYAPFVPEPGRLPVLLLAGMLAGAAWAALPGLLRVYGGVNEIISTLMLNYVALAWVEHLVYGPWKGADGFPYTASLDPSWHLPLLYKRVHAGIILVVLLALTLWWALRRTRLGYEVRVTGASPGNARYGGIPVLSHLLGVLVLAGGAGGLAGACVVAGVEHRLHAHLSPGYGYTAIIVAFLARRNLLLALLVSLLFAALEVGGSGLQVSFPAVSASTVYVFEGLLLLLVLAGGGLFRYRLARGEG